MESVITVQLVYPPDLDLTPEQSLANIAGLGIDWIYGPLPPIPSETFEIGRIIFYDHIQKLQHYKVNFTAFVANNTLQGWHASLLDAMLAVVGTDDILDYDHAYVGSCESIICTFHSVSDLQDDAPTPQSIVQFADDFEEDAPTPQAVVKFVDDLPTISPERIPKVDMRCPYCWVEFDEPSSPDHNNTPKRVPCCHKFYCKDCLVKVIEGTGTLCPLCRQEWKVPESPPRRASM
jgi:hypothetical protein